MKRVEVRAHVSNEVLLRFVLIDNSVCISWTNSFPWMLYLYISTMHADCYQWCHRIRVIPRPRLPDYQKLLASPCHSMKRPGCTWSNRVTFYEDCISTWRNWIAPLCSESWILENVRRVARFEVAITPNVRETFLFLTHFVPGDLTKHKSEEPRTSAIKSKTADDWGVNYLAAKWKRKDMKTMQGISLLIIRLG